MGGRVASVPVAEGATVKAGQPLVTFETDLATGPSAWSLDRVIYPV